MVQAELTREERSELLQVLGTLDPTRRALPPEHRRARRRGVLEWMPIYLLPTAAEDRKRVVRVLVKDVAAGGMGMYARRPLEMGTRFAFPVRFQEGGGALYLCVVTFSRKSSPRHFAIGAKFIESVDDPAGDAGVPSEWLGRS
jgi:hypothetical protein